MVVKIYLMQKILNFLIIGNLALIVVQIFIKGINIRDIKKAINMLNGALDTSNDIKKNRGRIKNENANVKNITKHYLFR